MKIFTHIPYELSFLTAISLTGDLNPLLLACRVATGEEIPQATAQRAHANQRVAGSKSLTGAFRMFIHLDPVTHHQIFSDKVCRLLTIVLIFISLTLYAVKIKAVAMLITTLLTKYSIKRKILFFCFVAFYIVVPVTPTE